MALFIVIGAGPAGCAVAATIAQSSHHQAILIESGPERPSLHESQRQWSLLGDPSRWRYRGGTGLGGSSLINAGIMGPIDTSQRQFVPVSVVTPGPVGARLLDASGDSQRLGVLGADGYAVSAADALGIGALAKSGRLAIRAETTVDSILLDGRRAVGVRTDSGEIFGDCVILAAGAIATPVLLADSGIDAEGVGEGLRDHPALMVSKGDPFEGNRRARPTALAPVPSAPPDAPSGHLLAIDGPVGGVADQAHPDCVRDGGDGVGAVMVGLLNSRRVGTVRRSPETGRVIVDLGPSVDVAALATLWSRARVVLDSPAMAPFVRDTFVDDWGTRFDQLTDDDARTMAWVRRAATGYFHASGTCSKAVDAAGNLDGYDGVVIADLSAVKVPPVWPMSASLARGQRIGRQLTSSRLR